MPELGKGKTVDYSGPIRQLRALGVAMKNLGVWQVEEDVGNWPAEIRSVLLATTVRKDASTGKLAASIIANGFISDEGYELRVYSKAPHWATIEFGSIESGMMGSRRGMPIRMGWNKQARMVGRVLYGKFTGTPGKPTRHPTTLGKFIPSSYPSEDADTGWMTIKKPIRPHGFIYQGMKKSWARTRAELMTGFERIKLK